MSLSYQARTRIKRIFTVITVVLTVCVVAWLCWLVWLDRFVVYDRVAGVRLDFSQEDFQSGVPVRLPPAREPVRLVYQDQDLDGNTPAQTKPITGYYISLDDLKINSKTGKSNIEAVRAQLEGLPEGSAVLLDVKNHLGAFYYSTMVGEKHADNVATEEFNSLIEYLTGGEFYVIARLPAFRDRHFGLNNIPSGLSYEGGGGALWLDKGNAFWLNPTKEKPLSYLISITKELKNMGFSEVVFTDFCFPEADNLVFSGDREEAIANAAATLVTACAGSGFWVSFTGDAAFPLPQGNSRLYLENIAAADVQTVAEQVATDDPAMHVLFYAASNDTRYDSYSVLRPLENAQ